MKTVEIYKREEEIKEALEIFTKVDDVYQAMNAEGGYAHEAVWKISGYIEESSSNLKSLFDLSTWFGVSKILNPRLDRVRHAFKLYQADKNPRGNSGVVMGKFDMEIIAESILTMATDRNLQKLWNRLDGMVARRYDIDYEMAIWFLDESEIKAYLMINVRNPKAETVFASMIEEEFESENWETMKEMDKELKLDTLDGLTDFVYKRMHPEIS